MLERPESQIGDFIDIYRSTFDEREKFWRAIGLDGSPSEKSTPIFIAAALKRLSETASIFTSVLLQDWLSMGGALAEENIWESRINFPGTTADNNWTLVMPISLEKMLKLPMNKKILAINQSAGRA